MVNPLGRDGDIEEETRDGTQRGENREEEDEEGAQWGEEVN